MKTTRCIGCVWMSMAWPRVGVPPPLEVKPVRQVGVVGGGRQ
jgi:hypothetical protein